MAKMAETEKPGVLYISHERKMGGANLSLFDLATEMKRRGYTVSVVVLFRGCPIDARLRDAGIETFPCLFGWWMQPSDWSIVSKLAFRFLHWMQWLSVIRISNYTRKKRIDIIHSNSSVIDIGAQVAKRVGCRHVWHFREFGKADYNLEYMLGRKKTIQYINNYADQVIFISKALMKSYAEIMNYIQIYNGIRDDAFYDNIENRVERKEFGFLISGNLSCGKNQMLVLEAVKKIRDKRGLYGFKLYLAGAATALKQSQSYEQEMRRYVADNNMTNVVFLGFVDNMKELRNTRIDTEIVASRSEAYGRVTIEAMASGNIIIASDAGSNPELIGANEHGILFRDNDSSDLADKMMWCMDNLKKKREIEENARKYAFDNHRMINNINQVENVYGTLLRKE